MEHILGFTPATEPEGMVRERLLMDFDWKFAFGHATDVSKDFNHATGQFSYLAKAGLGSGASARDFDDRGWRQLDLPHDWAAALPISNRSHKSHSFRTLGRNFPDTSVGWYRKTFSVPESDLGRRIRVEFDGVYRDSIVWINGHYLGEETSGYSGFVRNISELLNYGGENVIVVRVDASLEEGWFYEGAGIYRHVWLVKTAPLHVARHGTFITSELKGANADVAARVSVVNEAQAPAAFNIEQVILDESGQRVATARTPQLHLPAGGQAEFGQTFSVASPLLWSIETPNLHTLVTTVRAGGEVMDRYETTFGIRSIRFDANCGFSLNGRPVKLKGTCNHHDHAGVGVAVPDALMEYRIRLLKDFGCNLYRVGHTPPTPELLDACDRLGMLVIDENRLMGTTDYHRDHLQRLIRQNRNHPSIILWSIGNEEWALEGNDVGARITATMQSWAKQLDPTRPVTVALSGGWGRGISEAVDIAGINYMGNMRKCGYTTDEWHARHPDQPILGTEECAYTQTRGIYFEDREKCHLPAYDWVPSEWGASLEMAWKHFAERPYLAGMCIWTGFDYHGEPTPFEWPATSSLRGVLDLCGFPKDGMFYLKSWWTDEPVLHLFPHWNWPGREGQAVSVWVHSNCDEVELFLNGQSLGRKPMHRNSHLEWLVTYTPGTLVARGYKAGKQTLTAQVATTGRPAAVRLVPNRVKLNADGEDVSVVTVQVTDAHGRVVPDAHNLIAFELDGPGKILGVGNGDPSSHEAEQFLAAEGGEAPAWLRSLFGGLAQILVGTTREPGEITLTANAKGLSSATLILQSQPCLLRPSVPPVPSVSERLLAT